MTDGSEAPGAILAAATILDVATFRNTEAAALVTWAGNRINRFMSEPSSKKLNVEPLLVFAALSLTKTGAVAIPDGLLTRVNALCKVQNGNVWLWALAYDVFAYQHLKALALAAKLPMVPVAGGFALLRLHQLTGEIPWVVHARRLLHKHSRSRFLELLIALLMSELKPL